ncbi:MAG: AfsR/SARP family transcriptional regulator [Chloroflexus sp.]|uniref:AfsR/SARP family transcriptional regulator n=1 Tax=Chloroflexus sp. TaxID=1904827 RepID=UPI00404B050C
MIVVQLLGSPRIVVADHAVTLPRRRSRALLYYLTAHSQPVQREQVLSFFWPDHERSAAQQLLRSTLYAIRKTVGDALVADEEWLSLVATVDLRRLQALITDPQVDVAALTAALPVDQVELLAGFDLPDCCAKRRRSTMRLLPIRL